METIAIQFKQETIGDLDMALRREWLETQPPVGWMVLLSKLEETLFIDGRAFDLSAGLKSQRAIAVKPRLSKLDC